MATWTPDPTFYPSPAMAMQAPREELAYVAIINSKADGRSEALGVLDVDPASPAYGQLVGRLDLPYLGDELHHFGWNACSAALCPNMPHPHMERRTAQGNSIRGNSIFANGELGIDLGDDGVTPIDDLLEGDNYPSDAGIYGNSHMLMDVNNQQLAEIILDWLNRNAYVR